MSNKTSVDEILDFAIVSEEEARRFYLDLASRANNESMRKVFEDFAEEEEGHKVKLEKIKHHKTMEIGQAEPVMDLKIADYVVDIEPSPDMGYPEALMLAMKRERAAFELYTDLAEGTSSEECRAVFLALAQEEAQHKLRFEVEYDSEIMKEN